MANKQSQNGRGEYQIDEITMRKFAHKWEGVEKLVLSYVRTKWMALDKCCDIFFCELVRSSTLKHHRQQLKCRCFLHHNYDHFILCDN